MFHRIIHIPKNKHCFLFGARGTGKSTWLEQCFSKEQSLWVNLLEPETEQMYALEPSRLVRVVLSLSPSVTHVILDEIQKIPKLLDVVHLLIETHHVPQYFILTGSSARKLKAGGANLLAGRAIVRYLFPLLEEELKHSVDIESILRWGTLPRVINSSPEERDDDLRAYALTYLKEEVVVEQLIRKLDPFRRFLQVAAQANGKTVNFSNIAKDVGVDTKTVQSYFSILEDTLIGFFLENWHTSVRKRLTKAPKFYFFDLGVVRALAQHLRIIPISSTSYFGELFEQHVIREIVHRNASLNLDLQLGYIRTDRDVEIDLVIQRPGQPLALIEIKSVTHVTEGDTRALKFFLDDFPEAEFYLLSRDSTPQLFGKIKALPWFSGVAELTR
jgi:predicted AAA+ superfamily ATPase